MSRSSNPLNFASATAIVVGTSVAPSSPIPGNTIYVMVTNAGPAAGLVGLGVPGIALVDGTNAFPVPVDGVLSIPIGSQSDRGIMNQAEQTGSGLVYGTTVDQGQGGGSTFSILYLNTLGGY